MSTEGRTPYHCSSPIEAPDQFFGRASDLAFVQESIVAKKCVSFVGQPASGLSSLLNRLMAKDFQDACRQSGSELRFVCIACRDFADPLPLIQLVLDHLAPNRSPQRFPNWRPAFSRLVSATSALQDGRVVILFDDFEHIGLNQSFVDFIDALRGLTTAADMTLITTSHVRLHLACHKKLATSPFPNIFTVRYLGPFADGEAHEFLEATSARSGTDLRPYAEPILGLAGRFPYYLQVACSLYHRALTATAQVDQQAVATVFRAQVRPTLDRIWESLDEEERSLLAQFGRGEWPHDDSASLVRKGYVSEQGAFLVGALREYVLEKRS